jgi:large subunit ribosomal protein L10
MAKSREQKEQAVVRLSEKLAHAKSAVFADITGLKVADADELRKSGKTQKIDIVAIKKSLLKLVLKNSNLGEIDTKTFTGSLGVAISEEDEVAAAKMFKNFAATHKTVKFQGGILEGKVISAETVQALADLPSKQELLAKMVGSIKAPITGFVNVLAGNLRGLVTVLDAIKNNKS